MATSVETKLYSPSVVTEKVDGINIGRTILPVVVFTRWQPAETFHRFLNALNRPPRSKESVDLRRSLVFSMNNNTPSAIPGIAHERAVSAYFTHNPSDQVVIIEWGTINPGNKEARLHTYLNRVINYTERVKQGMKLSSGHIARVSATDEEIYLAFLDKLPPNDTCVSRDEPMGILVNTLHLSDFIPIAYDGSVRLPAF